MSAKNDIYEAVCFTGRRPKHLTGYKDISGYIHLRKQLVEFIKLLYYKYNTRKYYTGGAQGFDMIVCIAVSEAAREEGWNDYENIVVVPFKGQENLWEPPYSPFGKEVYRQMLRRCATDVIYLLDTVPATKLAVNGALDNRNCKMVELTSLTVSLYATDDWATEKGGTPHCMRVSRDAGHPIIQLYYEIEPSSFEHNYPQVNIDKAEWIYPDGRRDVCLLKHQN